MAAGDCGKCCFRFLITCGTTALFMWLALRTSNPTFSIEQFEASNRTLSFSLKLKNRNKDKGVYYDALNLAFSHALPNFPVANASFPPFYQGHGNSATRDLAISVDTLKNGSGSGSGNGNGFRVDLETGVRFKVVLWRTKRKRVRVGAQLMVDGEGNLQRGKKGVKLTSGVAEGFSCYRARSLWLVVSVFFYSILVGL